MDQSRRLCRSRAVQLWEPEPLSGPARTNESLGGLSHPERHSDPREVQGAVPRRVFESVQPGGLRFARRQSFERNVRKNTLAVQQPAEYSTWAEAEFLRSARMRIGI